MQKSIPPSMPSDGNNNDIPQTMHSSVAQQAAGTSEEEDPSRQGLSATQPMPERLRRVYDDATEKLVPLLNDMASVLASNCLQTPPPRYVGHTCVHVLWNCCDVLIWVSFCWFLPCFELAGLKTGCCIEQLYLACRHGNTGCADEQLAWKLRPVVQAAEQLSVKRLMSAPTDSQQQSEATMAAATASNPSTAFTITWEAILERLHLSDPQTAELLAARDAALEKLRIVYEVPNQNKRSESRMFSVVHVSEVLEASRMHCMPCLLADCAFGVCRSERN